MLHQLANQRLTFRLGDVAGHRPFVAVGTQVIRRLGGVLTFGVFQKRRPPGTGVVAAAGTFDFDDIGPQVGQCLGTPWARQYAGEVKNADTVK